MRKFNFEVGGFYHVYNRGVDRRDIVLEDYDSARFLQSLHEFNNAKLIGSIYENSFRKKQLGSSTPKLRKLVEIVCFCLNPNHFHLLLQQVSEGGIVKFMQRLGVGYTNYFNEKYKRSGALFQGRFKAKPVNSDDYLQYLSAYINLNDKIHQLGSSTPKSKMVRSSWEEYTGDKKIFCKKDIVLDQFGGVRGYEKYCLEMLPILMDQKKLSREQQELGFDE